ncbi:MAG: HNH endonuclease [Nanoarchaeota archaeon]
MIGNCELCERENIELTKHHLIPKQKNSDGRVAYLCIPCSKQVHALYNNRELKKLDTIEKLKQEEKIQTWINWVRKKNPSDIRYHGKARFHN